MKKKGGNNNQNLKSWTKGTSGNPKGKPKGLLSRKTIVRKFLEATLKGKSLPYGLEGTPTVAETLVLALIKKAQTGDVNAFRELFDSCYGKIADKTELTGADGQPLIPIIKDGI